MILLNFNSIVQIVCFQNTSRTLCTMFFVFHQHTCCVIQCLQLFKVQFLDKHTNLIGWNSCWLVHYKIICFQLCLHFVTVEAILLIQNMMDFWICFLGHHPFGGWSTQKFTLVFLYFHAAWMLFLPWDVRTDKQLLNINLFQLTQCCRISAKPFIAPICQDLLCFCLWMFSIAFIDGFYLLLSEEVVEHHQFIHLVPAIGIILVHIHPAYDHMTIPGWPRTLISLCSAHAQVAIYVEVCISVGWRVAPYHMVPANSSPACFPECTDAPSVPSMHVEPVNTRQCPSIFLLLVSKGCSPNANKMESSGNYQVPLCQLRWEDHPTIQTKQKKTESHLNKCTCILTCTLTHVSHVHTLTCHSPYCSIIAPHPESWCARGSACWWDQTVLEGGPDTPVNVDPQGECTPLWSTRVGTGDAGISHKPKVHPSIPGSSQNWVVHLEKEYKLYTFILWLLFFLNTTQWNFNRKENPIWQPHNPFSLDCGTIM